VVLVDYGAEAADLAARPAGTLLAYSASGVDDAVLESPGTKDVTMHANWTALARAMEAAGLTVTGPTSQREVLRALGLDELHEGLKADHDRALGDGRGADAVRALSRRQALGALADPSGLGRLEVIVGTKGMEPPEFVASE
jgi:SAM-dependent MidA family methyltransferase